MYKVQSLRYSVEVRKYNVSVLLVKCNDDVAFENFRVIGQV